MSTRANILITDFKNGSATPTGKPILLYHHYDGDEIGRVLREFIKDIPTGGAEDFALFLKDYTSRRIGYIANHFEDAKVISSDIDYMYYVDCVEYAKPDGGTGIAKAVFGYRFPHPKLSITGEEIYPSDGQLYDDSIYDKFSESRDFTRERIVRYWPQSFCFIKGIPDDILGGSQSPKED